MLISIETGVLYDFTIQKLIVHTNLVSFICFVLINEFKFMRKSHHIQAWIHRRNVDM